MESWSHSGPWRLDTHTPDIELRFGIFPDGFMFCFALLFPHYISILPFQNGKVYSLPFGGRYHSFFKFLHFFIIVQVVSVKQLVLCLRIDFRLLISVETMGIFGVGLNGFGTMIWSWIWESGVDCDLNEKWPIGLAIWTFGPQVEKQFGEIWMFLDIPHFFSAYVALL